METIKLFNLFVSVRFFFLLAAKTISKFFMVNNN